jgi:L-serine/L-threonine ammonia-lyase
MSVMSFRTTTTASSSSFCSSSSSSDYSRTKLLKKNHYHPKKRRRNDDDVRASSSSSSAFEEKKRELKLEWFNFGPRGTMLPQTFQQQKSLGFSSQGPLHVSTPLIYSQPLSERNERKTYIKMDNCQPSGSFKLRGLGYACQKALVLDGKKTFVSSSGGNAGLAVAYSGSRLGAKTTVVVPETTPEFIRDRLESYEAKVIVHGKQWSEANELAEKIAAEEDAFFAHPFEGEDTWTGHATLVHEMCAQLRDAGETVPPSFICTCVGGGGLLLGIAQGLREVGWAKTDVVVSETVGCDSLYQSVQKNELVTLPAITSVAKSLGAAQVSPSAFDLTKQWKREGKSPRIISTTVTDDQAIDACKNFANHHRALVEPACGACLALSYEGKIREMQNDMNKNGCVVVEVCGGAITDLSSFLA